MKQGMTKFSIVLAGLSMALLSPLRATGQTTSPEFSIPNSAIVYFKSQSIWKQNRDLHRLRSSSIILVFNSLRYNATVTGLDQDYANTPPSSFPSGLVPVPAPESLVADQKKAIENAQQDLMALVNAANQAILYAYYRSDPSESDFDDKGEIIYDKTKPDNSPRKKALTGLVTWWFNAQTTGKDTQTGNALTDAQSLFSKAAATLATTNRATDASLINAAAEALKRIEKIITGRYMVSAPLEFIPHGDDYQLSISFSEVPPPLITLVPAQGNAPQPKAGTPPPNPQVQTPVNDPAKTPANAQVQTPAPTNDASGTPLTADSHTKIFPVNFGLFESVKPSFSVGLLYSNLHDKHYVANKQSDGTFLISSGANDGSALKAVALLHLSVWKHGDFLSGPALGATLGMDGKALGYFAGWGFEFGKAERLALNVGFEFGSVARLNGTQVGEKVASDQNLTTNVNRNIFGFALTYAFSTGGGNGTKKTSAGAQNTTPPATGSSGAATPKTGTASPSGGK